MGRKLRARNAVTGDPINVDIDDMKVGPIRNRSLSEPLLRRIRRVHERIRDVYGLSLEQFEIGFMRDANPSREVGVWEQIVESFEKVTAMMPEADRKMVLRVLLLYSMNGLTHVDRSDPLVSSILRIIEE